MNVWTLLIFLGKPFFCFFNLKQCILLHRHNSVRMLPFFRPENINQWSVISVNRKFISVSVPIKLHRLVCSLCLLQTLRWIPCAVVCLIPCYQKFSEFYLTSISCFPVTLLSFSLTALKRQINF